MRCLQCNSKNVEIGNSRKYPSTVWRRRICRDCDFIFTTNERTDISKLLRIQESVRKKQSHPYSRGRLLQGLYEALSHKIDDLDAPLFLLATIEEALVKHSAKSSFIITSQKLHEIAAEILARYDSLAALNYKARLK